MYPQISAGTASSLFLALFLACEFTAGRFGFNPQGNILALTVASFWAVMVIYLWLQIRAIIYRRGTSSIGMGKDTFFSIFPMIVLIGGLIVRAIVYVAVPPAGSPHPEVTFGAAGSWIIWVAGFLTELEWLMLIPVFWALWIDIYEYTIIANLVTQTGRYETDSRR